MSAVLRIALADWQARTRSFAFLIVTALSLECAYLFIPDIRAGYVTVSIGAMRGIYNAPWMGAITALLSVLLIAYVGFYLIRGAVVRDETAGCSGIVAATPIGRFAFVAGKWGSNCAVLLFVATILLVGCAIMQQVRGEDRSFDLASYVVPFALIVIPACALVAAFAVLFDTIRPLRGMWGAVLWFFLMPAATAIPITSFIAGRASPAMDPLGIVPVIAGIGAGMRAQFSKTNINDLTIGGDDDTVTRTFVWHGMPWTAQIAAERIAWIVVAIAIVGLASLAFDRFANARTRVARTWRFPVGRLVPDVAGLRLLRAELIVLAGDSGVWWTAAAIACGIAGAFAPKAALLTAVLPLAFVLPLARYGSLGTRDRDSGVDGLVMSAPHAATRTIVARIVAAGAIGCVPLAGALFHYPALVVVPFASAALAIVVGRISGTPRAFEALYLAVWYLGSLNHAPVVDLANDAATAPATLAAVGLATTLGAAIVARAQRIVWRPLRREPGRAQERAVT